MIQLKALPWRGILGALLMVFGFIMGHRYASLELVKYKAEQVEKVAALEKKAAEVTTVEVTKYVDRVQVVHEQGATITKKVPVYVPRNVCVLPAAVRSLHDSAATGRALPDTP